jgi:glycerophosphoryl diester phosphodiesterase
MARMLAMRRPQAHPLVVGHRGAKGHAPENTMSAFRTGGRLGADLVECDVHMSHDGHLVVFHDDHLDRTTDGKGWLKDHDLADLAKLDAGQGERIPTLDTLLEWVAASPPLGVVIEIKNGPTFYERIDCAVADAITRHDLVERALVISFDHLVVRELKRRLPGVATGILYYARLADPMQVAWAALAESIWPALPMVTPNLVQQAHEAGLAVFTWTANSPEDFDRALAAGVDGIGTDFPDLLLSRLEKL